MPYPWNHFFHILVFYILLHNNTIANNIMKCVSPLKKKKLETQIGQIGANQENWAASIARAGAKEPPWGSGSPRLRRRRRRNKRRSPQPSTARSAREGRRSESSCEFFFAPPLPSAPQPAGRRSFTSFRAERQVLGLPSIDMADPSHPPQWRPAFAQLQNLCLLSLARSLSQEVQAEGCHREVQIMQNTMVLQNHM